MRRDCWRICATEIFVHDFYDKLWNEMKWKCGDLKCVQKPTRGRLSLTHWPVQPLSMENHRTSLAPRGISPNTSSASPISTAAVSGRRHPHSWWSDVHGCPLLAIVRFLWLEAASGTVCRPTSFQLQLWLFSGDASKLISFPDHFLPNCFRFIVLYTVYSDGLAVLYLNYCK